MKVLLVGTGGVGEAIATIAKERSWVEQVVLTDYNRERLEEVQAKLGDLKRFPIEWIDASNQAMVEDLAQKYKVNMIMNACDPVFNEPIFDAAYQCRRQLHGYGDDTVRAASDSIPSISAASSWGITSLSVPRIGKKRASYAWWVWE